MTEAQIWRDARERGLLMRILTCARVTLTETRREFPRGELRDVDQLEDAIAEYDKFKVTI